jgi:octaprenyl-diphosphate synthase
VFTPAKFDDPDFGATSVRLYFRRYLGTLDIRSAYLNVITINQHQDIRDLDGFTLIHIKFFDLDDIASFDLILLATGIDYRVHSSTLHDLRGSPGLSLKGADSKEFALWLQAENPVFYIFTKNQSPRMAISPNSWQNGAIERPICHPVYTIAVKYPEAIAIQRPEMDIKTIRALIKEDMDQVDTLIQQRLYSDVGLIDQLGHYIVNSGGKRLRPALLLLSAKMFSYTGNQYINLAAIIEFIHTATLLHDDVVDASLMRRGKATANQRWGNEASVLVGDFVYSRAFQMMVDTDSMHVMQIMSDATNTIAEGEVQQLVNRHDPDTTEASYLAVIHNKTAKLFEAAAQLGAVLCNRPGQEEIAMANYGRHLGTAFQLIDDVLDYSSSSSELGKNIGDDLAEGKPTLPLLYAMWHGTAEQSSIIRSAIENGGLENIATINNAIETTGAIAYTAGLARQEANMGIEALDIFPDSEYLDALYSLAKFSVDRSS